VGIEDLDDLGEVEERPGQPVDLIDDHHIDLARRDIAEKRFEDWTVQGLPEKPPSS
jgi:hypothetical protein